MNKIEKVSRINELCKKYDKKDYPGIAVAVVDNGELIFNKGYGDANLDYNIPINEETVFHVCSIAKQFTATCIALLIEEGKISLDQSITTILPELNNCYKNITVANLLYMTNGIPDVYETACFECGIREDESITKDEFWKYIKACDWTVFDAGEKWSYGNTGYFLLGQIVETITKMSLSQYADEHIFKPLGMNHTFIRDDRTKIIKNRAVGYSNYEYLHYNDSYKRYISRGDKLCINEENVEVGGAGQLWTTLSDLLLWDKNFDNSIIGKDPQKFIKLLTTSGLLSSGEECKYGFGLQAQDFHGNKIIHHGGWAGGYSAYYAKLLDKKTSVIILGNHTDFIYDFLLNNGGLTDHILNLLIGYDEEEESSDETKKVIAQDKTEKVNNERLEIYEGSYRCEKLGVSYSVKVSEDKLFIRNENCHNNAMDLYYNKADEDIFVSDSNSHNGSLCVTFMRCSDNKIS